VSSVLVSAKRRGAQPHANVSKRQLSKRGAKSKQPPVKSLFFPRKNNPIEARLLSCIYSSDLFIKKYKFLIGLRGCRSRRNINVAVFSNMHKFNPESMFLTKNNEYENPFSEFTDYDPSAGLSTLYHGDYAEYGVDSEQLSRRPLEQLEYQKSIDGGLYDIATDYDDELLDVDDLDFYSDVDEPAMLTSQKRKTNQQKRKTTHLQKHINKTPQSVSEEVRDDPVAALVAAVSKSILARDQEGLTTHLEGVQTPTGMYEPNTPPSTHQDTYLQFFCQQAYPIYVRKADVDLLEEYNYNSETPTAPSDSDWTFGYFWFSPELVTQQYKYLLTVGHLLSTPSNRCLRMLTRRHRNFFDDLPWLFFLKLHKPRLHSQAYLENTSQLSELSPNPTPTLVSPTTTDFFCITGIILHEGFNPSIRNLAYPVTATHAEAGLFTKIKQRDGRESLPRYRLSVVGGQEVLVKLDRGEALAYVFSDLPIENSDPLGIF